jgi:hypothetical protein
VFPTLLTFTEIHIHIGWLEARTLESIIVFDERFARW